MFRNKSAWFSSSVPAACQDFWILEGGSIDRCRTADYLFSEDATCPDTVRIFESRDYLWNQVAVFHSLFLTTCEQRRSARSVRLGHYVLPPASVQDEVREVVGRFIWEADDEQLEMESGSSEGTVGGDGSDSASSPGGKDALRSHLTDSTDSETGAGKAAYINMDSLPQYSGDLHSYQPGCLRCFNCKAPCCALHT